MYSIKLTEATFKIIVVSNDSKISRNLPWFCRAGDFNKGNNLFCELHVCHKLNFLFALDRLQILQGVNNITKCLSLADGLESEPNRPIYCESSGTIFKASTFNLSRISVTLSSKPARPSFHRLNAMIMICMKRG